MILNIPELRLQMAELERDRIAASVTAEWNELLKRRYRGPILRVELSPYQVILTEEVLHGIIQI